ncbi:MAG: hypothetical protein Q9197_003300 [Variospora fuerteventurae]
MASLGIVMLTAIQEAMISTVLGTKEHFLITPSPTENTIPNIYAAAQTGIGKTIAYLIPVVELLTKTLFIKSGVGAHPRVLVLCHTREIAIQVYKMTVHLTQNTDLQCRLVHGGKGTWDIQKSKLERGCDILIATPGRLMNQLRKQIQLSLSNLRLLILDEGHILVEDKWDEQLRSIISYLPDPSQYRKWTFASAISTPDIQRIASKFYSAQESLTQVSPDLSESTPFELPPHVTVHFDAVGQQLNAKRDMLLKTVDENVDDTFIILVNTIAEIYDVGEVIYKRIGDIAYGTHSRRQQAERESIFSEFESGKKRVVVATYSLFAYGVHISRATWVILFHVPLKIEDYLSAIGRVGRLGRVATASVYYDPSNNMQLALLQQVGLRL